MKLVSKPCSICKEPIMFQPEGTWCEYCQTAFHKECIQKRDDVCPSCKKIFKKPSDPLNLKKKNLLEGVKRYPKEYILIVVLPVAIVSLCIIVIAWLFLSWQSFGIFLVILVVSSIIFEVLFTPLLLKFDDWILTKIKNRKG